MPSEEQLEANSAIGEALERWITTLPYDQGAIEEGIGVLGDWVAVTCMVDVNEDGQPVAHYYLSFKGTSMLPHIAEGLLRQGLLELKVNPDAD